MTVSDDELVMFFDALERGEIRLVALEAPQEIYAGNVRYRASNGWALVVFNDCNEYDYVDELRSPDGRSASFDDLDCREREWQPDDEVAWRCLGIPGYCKFRCNQCGAQLPLAGQRRAPFLCGDGRCAGKNDPAVGTWVKVDER